VDANAFRVVLSHPDRLGVDLLAKFHYAQVQAAYHQDHAVFDEDEANPVEPTVRPPSFGQHGNVLMCLKQTKARRDQEEARPAGGHARAQGSCRGAPGEIY
jgi:hypothetical protein